jgi:putative membrane protein
MTRQQLTKPIYIWVLTALIACGLWVVAGKAGINIHQGQNSNNQNGNQNGNSNTGNQNTGNTNTSNANANRNQNRNANTNTGGGGGMAGMSQQDHKFVMETAMGGLKEVELGRIAAQQGATDAVKQFGQRMVDDHTKANTELMTLATSKGMTLPTELDEKHRQDVTKLSGMSGAAFDRAYARMMVNDHKKKVDNFEKQSERGGDPDLKAFATRTLPTVQEHLQMARALPGAEGGGGDNTNAGGMRNTNTGEMRNSNTGGARNTNSNTNRNRNSNTNGNNNGNGNSNNSNRP